jgi:hypothetical protein
MKCTLYSHGRNFFNASSSALHSCLPKSQFCSDCDYTLDLNLTGLRRPFGSSWCMTAPHPFLLLSTETIGGRMGSE